MARYLDDSLEERRGGPAAPHVVFIRQLCRLTITPVISKLFLQVTASLIQ